MTQTLAAPGPRVSLRAPVLAGAIVTIAFVGGFGGWAAVAPLAGAAVAPAVVVPEGSRKTVQHLEGGIVRQIHVRDGSMIAAGEVLLTLDDTQARAEHATLMAEANAARAVEARLVAEQNGSAAPRFPETLLEAATGDPVLAGVIAGEADRLSRRRSALADRNAVLEERIMQLREQIRGLEAKIAASGRQLALIELELADVRGLVAKGLERRPRLLALERSQAQIEGSIGADRAEIAQARQGIAEARQQQASLVSEEADKTAAELADVRQHLARLNERLRATADRLARTVVTAPVAGTIVDLQVTTTGGVIEQGAALMAIVPAGAELILEVRVTPSDIDEIHPGLDAQVHLLAYKSRSMPRIKGLVRNVSADRLEDAATRQPYYRAQVAIDPGTLPPDVALAPGMPADVLITTSERTLLDYLLTPLRDSVRKGLRES
ncbi:HlyD family type I secretion periplasmic adaptor subunit [Arenibaculum pallidiluteum]|uniref:HlyD family type I secretion periplasmic adaptor subunit n=1 Tax=Arenibaculum pallidiluteum TaxID=2812559 RepID=UPI001A95B77F|nr:HlyD family type I secretion periplasmic adaptor subunit [Arenibaculum pallidiluteum]